MDINNKNDNNLSKSEICNQITNAMVYVNYLITKARFQEVEAKNQKILFKQTK